jgi:hypothetical protein
LTQSIPEELADKRFSDLEATLARLGADYSAVVQTVDTAVGLGPQHVLLGVGSVAEGLGTSKSDFDLLLISAADADSDSPEAEHAWMVGRCIVDLQVVRWARVEALISRLREWAQLPWDISRAAGFSYEERQLLHRLLHGCQLFPEHHQAPPFRYRPPVAELARLKLQVARHMTRTTQVDLVGYRDSADYPSLVFAAQELLGHAVDGLLAGHHVTNPAPKWRSRLLQSLAPDWSRPLAIRPPQLSADRLFWHLHRAPAEPDRGPALAHAAGCVSFARAVLAWAEPHLVQSSAIDRVPLTWSRQRPHPPEGALPSLELDVDFRISAGRAAVARLNEFGGSLTLTPQELAVLLLFDGETTVGEVESACAGLSGDGSTAVDVARLIESATRAGLCMGPHQHQPGSDMVG